MTQELKYPFAIDSVGDIITPSEAIPRTDYSCLGCNSIMRRRQGSKRPHFYHKADVSNCSSESVLHLGFKKLLYNRIKEKLESNEPLMIEWKCELCTDIHTRNLISKSKQVVMEMSFGSTRPDISLLDENGRLLIAIEVVVTHEPEEAALQYYKENKVTVIRFKISSDEDLELIKSDNLRPTSVGNCTNPRCKKCNRHTYKKSLWLINGRCWKCKYQMNVAAIFITDGRHITPEHFSDEEVQLANSLGANIQLRYSKTVRDKYYANACRRCNNIAGKHFLFTEYIAPAHYGDLKYDVHDLGYRCIKC